MLKNVLELNGVKAWPRGLSAWGGGWGEEVWLLRTKRNVKKQRKNETLT